MFGTQIAYIPFLRCETKATLASRPLTDEFTEFYFTTENVLSPVSFVTPKAWGILSVDTVVVEESEEDLALEATIHFIVSSSQESCLLHLATILQVHTTSPKCTIATTGESMHETWMLQENAQLVQPARKFDLTGQTFSNAMASLRQFPNYVRQPFFTLVRNK